MMSRKLKGEGMSKKRRILVVLIVVILLAGSALSGNNVSQLTYAAKEAVQSEGSSATWAANQDIKSQTRQIRYSGDEMLRKKSEIVGVIDDEIRQILNDMAEIMYTKHGEGLAAPQIGILKRLVVIDIGEGLIKLVNPKIIKQEGGQKVRERCLSIPNTLGLVKRPARVVVQALNENGEEIILTGQGDLAKSFCHEIDHLDGILFTDLDIVYIR